MTAQQLERAMSAVSAWAMPRTHDVLDGALRRISRPRPSSRGFGIHISYRSRPFYPQPLPGIDEEKLIRVRQCPACDLHYAVFGEHRFCPVCGPLPVDLVALDALAAETFRLDALTQLPAAAAADLREQGVFTRIWVDTLKNLAGIVETLAGAVFRAAVANADQVLQGKGNIFQRLDPAADLFVTHGYPDLRQRLDPAVWQRLLQTWAVRHVFIHRDGVVDGKYLTVVSASTVQLGQRLTVTEPQGAAGNQRHARPVSRNRRPDRHSLTSRWRSAGDGPVGTRMRSRSLVCWCRVRLRVSDFERVDVQLAK
ncbi:hypothetical protein ABZS66_00165 [Dactylosporangium sp. NPDC005572]|uniref:hypothetical protein n=1 Tax=Dactylosporangium sp. NPDC005572 TaxID=3156889 RepID=UPI0033AF01E3